MIVLLFIETEVGEERHVADELAKLENVTEVYLTTGEHDVFAKMDVKEVDDAVNLVTGRIRKMDEVESTRTIFTKSVK